MDNPNAESQVDDRFRPEPEATGVWADPTDDQITNLESHTDWDDKEAIEQLVATMYPANFRILSQ